MFPLCSLLICFVSVFIGYSALIIFEQQISFLHCFCAISRFNGRKHFRLYGHFSLHSKYETPLIFYHFREQTGRRRIPCRRDRLGVGRPCRAGRPCIYDIQTDYVGAGRHCRHCRSGRSGRPGRPGRPGRLVQSISLNFLYLVHSVTT